MTNNCPFCGSEVNLGEPGTSWNSEIGVFHSECNEELAVMI